MKHLEKEKYRESAPVKCKLTFSKVTITTMLPVHYLLISMHPVQTKLELLTYLTTKDCQFCYT